MLEVKFDCASFALDQNESVLDCLLRNGKQIPYACKAGMCQACLIKAVDCEAPEAARKWIKKSLQEKGFALACQWVPDTDIEVDLPGVAESSVAVSINSLEPLSDRVMRVTLCETEAGTMFHYHPGQYLTLINPAGVARSYSIANDFEQDRYLELHIGLAPQGLFSKWLFDEANVGDLLHIRGPAGDCFYSQLEVNNDYPMVLAGTGTGLAPLYGIVKDALCRGHSGPIHLYHGSLERGGLYYGDALSQLQLRHKNFFYHPCVFNLGSDAPLAGEYNGDIREIVARKIDLATISQARVYLCGNPEFVHSLRKQVFLKGVKSGNIHCDPFLERKVGAV